MRKKKQKERMNRKKKSKVQEAEIITGKDLAEKDKGLSLEPLAKDKSTGHSFSETERKFITLWIEFKNISLVAQMMKLEQDEILSMLSEKAVRNEIDRISAMRVKKRFAERIMTLDDMEGYLTSLVTDKGVPFAERLNEKDKLNALKLLLEVKDMKAGGLAEPSTLDNLPIEDEIKELSVDTIKELLSRKIDNPKALEENRAIRQKAVLAIPNATPNESADISSMTPKELLNMLDRLEKEKK